jgi:hypothetical protein
MNIYFKFREITGYRRTSTGDYRAGGDSFDESKLVFQEIKQNDEFLNQRQKELEEVAKVANQVKKLTDDMVVKTKEQGDLLCKLSQLCFNL